MASPDYLASVFGIYSFSLIFAHIPFKAEIGGEALVRPEGSDGPWQNCFYALSPDGKKLNCFTDSTATLALTDFTIEFAKVLIFHHVVRSVCVLLGLTLMYVLEFFTWSPLIRLF